MNWPVEVKKIHFERLNAISPQTISEVSISDCNGKVRRELRKGASWIFARPQSRPRQMPMIDADELILRRLGHASCGFPF